MTRFARAKGSKASNERVAEEATSWNDIKQQLDDKKNEAENQKHQNEAVAKRKQNYDNFLKEVEKDETKNSQWAPFSETLTQKQKAHQKLVDEKKEKEITLVESSANGVGVDKKKKAKKRKLETPENGEVNISSDTKSPSNNGASAGDKVKKNKKMKKVVSPAPVKKTVEEMTEEEKKKFNKNKEKKLRQLEKRKLKKQLKDKNPGPTTDVADSGEQVVAPSLKQSNNNNNKGTKPQPLTKTPPKVKKFDKNKEHKRRKPVDDVQKVKINGLDIELVYFDGFPIKREDAERLKELRKKMISKGLPKSEVKAAMKLERRRAEKSLSRDKKNVCYNCRQAGHVLSECPAISADGNMDTAASGICFKCGSTEHTSYACKVVKNQEFRFASCFICKEQGHISWQCPDNARGLYPKGGGCKVCGDVTHLKKDCPKYVAEQEASAVSLPMLTGDNPDSLESKTSSPRSIVSTGMNKIVKF